MLIIMTNVPRSTGQKNNNAIGTHGPTNSLLHIMYPTRRNSRRTGISMSSKIDYTANTFVIFIPDTYDSYFRINWSGRFYNIWVSPSGIGISQTTFHVITTISPSFIFMAQSHTQTGYLPRLISFAYYIH